AARSRHRRCRHHRRGRRPAAAARPVVRGARVRPARGAAVDARGLRGPPRRPAGARPGAAGRRRLHARHPPGGDRRRDRELPQAAADPDRGQRRAVQRGGPRSGGGHGPRALRLRLLEHGVRAGDGVSDHGGARLDLPRPALGLRLLQAPGRGPRSGRRRRVRAAVDDLPPVQRLRARRAARGR
ncbi:MAG: UDP-glucose 4-epimerase, partial [uncultured Solirubrobacteraceae bacterium]